MPASTPDLETPVLLLAMPQVVDPFFSRSVVLLLHHTDEGSLGFIINRPTEIQLHEILKGMEIAWNGASDALAFFGGPVQSQMGTVIFGSAAGVEVVAADGNGLTEICPGVLMTQQMEDLGKLALDPPARFRLYLGYAGWDAGQLVSEIMRNDWLTAPVRDRLLFCDHPDTVWEEALQSLGVDPAGLPAWTPNGADKEAN